MPTPFHIEDCLGPEDCGGTYTCEVCHQEVGWCFGADGNMWRACDDCWYKAHQHD